jgi:ankyrin repeat protein
LLYAAHGDAPDTLRQLLHTGADVQATSLIGFGSVRYASRNCTTVLHTLLEAGASILPQEHDEGLTALHAACVSVGWHPMVLRELLKRSTNDSLNVVDFLGRTPLHLAAAIDMTTSVSLIVGRLLQASKSRRQIRAVSAQEAFTPVLPCSIHNWAIEWGSPLSRLANDTTSEQLHREVTILVQKIKASTISMLGEKGPRVDTRDALGQTPLHLASGTSFPGRILEHSGHETDTVIKSLLDSGSTTECQNTSGQRPLDIALAQGSWPTALTLLRADEANEVLPGSSRLSMEAIILQNAGSELTGHSPTSMFASMKKRHYPSSLLDILEVSYILQARLSLIAPRDLLVNGRIVDIVSSILDFTEYWAISTSEFSLNADQFVSEPPLADARLGKGRVRKLEIYVARPAMRRRTRMHPCELLLCCDFGTLFSGSTVVYSSSPHRTTSRAEGDPFHKDGALLQLVRNHRSGSTTEVSIGVGEEATPATKSVSATPALWENVELEGTSLLDQIWKQTWPFQLSTQRSGGVPETEVRRVMSWMESLKEGDEITLSLSEEFFVQDIALYSKFGLVLYTALA